MRVTLPTAFALAFTLGCGAAAPVASEPEVATVDPATVAPTEPPARQGTISRAELDPILAAGLGRFLAHLGTEPHLDDGRFVGFRVTELRSDIFAGVDLQVGDTLVSVNGAPIERPEQALEVWNGLAVASELTIEYLRDGQAEQLRFAIED